LPDSLNYTIHFVSRLDRETSGIVLCAKKSSYVKNFIQALKNGKMYLAPAWGKTENNIFSISMLLGEKTRRSGKKKTRPKSGGKTIGN